MIQRSIQGSSSSLAYGTKEQNIYKHISLLTLISEYHLKRMDSEKIGESEEIRT